MRFFEILLTFANLLAFVMLIAPLPGSLYWLRYSVLLAPLLAAAQALVEGPRWQMIPAYALAGLFFVIWLLRYSGLAGEPAGAGQVSWLAAGLVIATALPLLIPVFRFPKPSGPYAIGTLTYHWVDADRPEITTPAEDDRRELVVQIWYPADADVSSPRAPYLPEADALISALARVQGIPAFNVFHGNLKYVTTYAVPSAPVAGGEDSYPVLVFLEGLTGFRQMNTFQVEELASHGYIVAAIDQPSAAATVVFPDGRQADMPPLDQIRPLVQSSYIPPEEAPTLNGQPVEGGSIIPYYASDVRFTLDQLAVLNQSDPNGILTGRLDLERTGIIGVSLGGIVGAETCRVDARPQACVFLDATMPVSVVQEGLRQPAIWITRDPEYMRLERQQAGGWPEIEIEAHMTSMRAVYNSLPAEGYYVEIPGIFHSNFTDIPYWSPLIPRLGFAGPIDVKRAFEIINAYSLAFFDRHLKGESAARFDELLERFPEVTLETHRPFEANENHPAGY